MSLYYCQFSYCTDLHTVAGPLTTTYSTLSQLFWRLIDQIQPTLYFSVNDEEAPLFSEGFTSHARHGLITFLREKLCSTNGSTRE